MAVSNQNPINEYNGNGSVKSFTFTFLINSTADIKVYLNSVLQSSGYSVSGVGNQSGGTVTFTTAPASGALVTLRRLVELARTTDYQEAAAIPTDTLDRDFDRLWMAVQDGRVGTMTQNVDRNWDAQSRKVVNVADPVNAQDAATKHWVETSGTSFVTQATTQAGIATTKATEAAASATVASTKATEASASASTATTKASEAAASATTATNQASSAANSASSAATSAASVTGAVIDATAQANAAALSATQAQTFRNNAATSATESAGSAAAALTHKNSASSSAQTAATQAQIALDAVASMGDIEADLEAIDAAVASSLSNAQAAQTYASTAQSLAIIANDKAGEAATSATNAAASATTATTKAGDATAQAGIATTKAGEAAASATAAATSATNSAASAQTASDLKDQMQDIIDNWEGGTGGDVVSVNGMTGAVTIGKADVGLGNVANLAPADLPLSTAATSALAGKEPSIAAGSTSQYLRGDKSWQTLNAASVGLGNVNNTSDASKPISTATQTALDAKANTSSLGTVAALSYPGGTTLYLRADGTWVAPPSTSATWGSITGTLSSQSDLNSALALKAALAGPAFTGTPTAPTATAGTNTTQLATTAFVTTAANTKANLSGAAFTGAVTISAAGSLTVSSKALTAPSTVTYAASMTVNSALSNVFYVSLTGNVTTFAISNPTDGQTINIRFAQDATGGRTVTLPSSVKADGTQLTTASRVAWLSITYVSSASRWEGGWVAVPA